jgi:hypothetical protein
VPTNATRSKIFQHHGQARHLTGAQYSNPQTDPISNQPQIMPKAALTRETTNKKKPSQTMDG